MPGRLMIGLIAAVTLSSIAIIVASTIRYASSGPAPSNLLLAGKSRAQICTGEDQLPSPRCPHLLQRLTRIAAPYSSAPCRPIRLDEPGQYADRVAQLSENNCFGSVKDFLTLLHPVCTRNARFPHAEFTTGSGGAEPCEFFGTGGVEYQIAEILCSVLSSNIAQQDVNSGDAYVEKIVFDIGMNSGQFATITAAHGFQVIAIEPQPRCHVAAHLSIHRSGLSPFVRFVECGAGSSSNATESFQESSELCGVGNTVQAKTATTTTASLAELTRTTFITSIDEQLFTYAAPLTHVPIAKIDTEGFEPHVIRGARKALQSCRIANLVIEVIPHYWKEGRFGLDLESGIQSINLLVSEFGFSATLLIDQFGGDDDVDNGVKERGRRNLPHRTVLDLPTLLRHRSDAQLGANIWFHSPRCDSAANDSPDTLFKRMT
eukprot:SAG31_NODE_2205_length_6195_cov_4.592520_8_plen_432_part_00